MPLYLTDRLSSPVTEPVHLTLSLTAEERTRSRHYFETDETIDGEGVHLNLARGTVLRHGDVLRSEDGKTLVQIVAKPEPVMTVLASTPLDLLRAAYHLGNRHVPLEVKETYLRLSPDPVLRSMLEQMGVQITEDVLPFEPEAGAYNHPESSHAHRHAHSHAHG
ncbi:MAG: urease accessory protein UreE [Cyanobacteria bacterium RM1_2_2]|nr:urease accessory protein UreE [Cyanobacteria bacterium RM1_2_2]